MFWKLYLAKSTQFYCGIICWICFWLIISIRLFSNFVAFKTLSLLSAILGGAFLSNTITEINNQNIKMGVIIDPTLIYIGHHSDDQLLLEKPLNEGLEFRIINRRTNWIEIELPDQQTGWILEKNSQFIY